MKEDFLSEFLKFDPVCFFNVIIKLFTDEPFEFLVKENLRERNLHIKNPELIKSAELIISQFNRVIKIILKSENN